MHLRSRAAIVGPLGFDEAPLYGLLYCGPHRIDETRQ
jgi:hypothetical protein